MVCDPTPCYKVFPNQLQTRCQTLYSVSVEDHVRSPRAAEASGCAERGTYMLVTIRGNCPKSGHFLSGDRHVIFRDSTWLE